MKFKRLYTKEIIIFSLFIAFFILASVLTNIYEDSLKDLIKLQGGVGMAVYVSLTIIAEVVAPVSVLPLLPVAATLWGTALAALLSILGWTIGAQVAFGLARIYGRPLINKIINLERVEEIGHAIPEKNLFWTTLFIRMILPVDIVSYALGLFTKIGWLPFLAATAIGVSPFAFLIARASSLSFQYQILAGAALIIFIAFSYRSLKRRILAWLKESRGE